jgi:hypothetical protein
MAVYQLLTLSSIIVWVYVMPKAFTKRLPELNIPNYSLPVVSGVREGSTPGS